MQRFGGRPWVSPQGAPILKEEGETQALDLPSLKGRRTHEPYLQENSNLRGEEESQARSSGGPYSGVGEKKPGSQPLGAPI